MTKQQAWPYMKFYTFYLDDVEFLELERTARLRYLECYVLAWKADANGDLLNPETGNPLNVKHIALLLRDNENDVSNDLRALESANFLNMKGNIWNITRYEDEQENQKEMKKIWRERKAQQRNKSIQKNKNEIEEKVTEENEIKYKSLLDVSQDSRKTLERQANPPSAASAYDSGKYKAQYSSNVNENHAHFILLSAAKLAAIPSNELARVETVQAMLLHYGEDKTIEALSDARQAWVNTPRKTGGGTYASINFGWVDWAQEYLSSGKAPWNRATKMEKPDPYAAFDRFLSEQESDNGNS